MEASFEQRLRRLFGAAKTMDNLWESEDATFCVFRKNVNGSVSLCRANQKYLRNLYLAEEAFERPVEELFEPKRAAMFTEAFELLQKSAALHYAYEIIRPGGTVIWQITAEFSAPYAFFWGREVSVEDFLSSCNADAVDLMDFSENSGIAEFLVRAEDGGFYPVVPNGDAAASADPLLFQWFRASRSFADACMRRNEPACYLSFAEENNARTYLFNLLIPLLHEHQPMLMVRIARISLADYLRIFRSHIFVQWEKNAPDPKGRALGNA